MNAAPPPRLLSAVLASVGTPVEACAPAGLHGHMCSRPASGTDAGERSTCRGGADTAGPETYLEVLEPYWGGGSWLWLTVGTRTLIEEAQGIF